MIKKHFSFLILTAGAGALYFSNLFLKGILSPLDYGKYSLIATLIASLRTFGLLGSEQIMLRNSSFINSDIQFDAKIFKIILFSFFAAILFIPPSFYIKYSYISDFFKILLIVVFSSNILFFFNYFRLQSFFNISQFINNFWKLSFLIILILSFNILNSDIEINTVVNMIIVLTGLTCLVGWVLFFKHPPKITNQHLTYKELSLYLFSFFFSITTSTVLILGDRFIIEEKNGIESLGEYFFLSTIFLFPFSFFQSYIGFKELVKFKKQQNIDGLSKSIAKVFGMGIILGMTILFIAKILEHFSIIMININDNFILILLLLIMGSLRLIFAFISAAFGALGNRTKILKANIYLLITFLLLCPFFYHTEKIEDIVSLFLVLWGFRILIWYFNLKKSLV